MKVKPTRTLTIFTSLFLIFAMATPAAALQVGVKINGGPLGFSMAGSAQLPDANLSGYDQAINGSLGVIDVVDARGTGTGWNIVVSAADFLNTDGSGATVPASGFTVDSTPTVTKIAGNTEPAAFPGPLNQPLTLLAADVDTGMGRFQTNPGVSLTIPAGTTAGTYESTLTVTIASGL